MVVSKHPFRLTKDEGDHASPLLQLLTLFWVISGPVVRIGPNDLSINDLPVYLETTQLTSGFTKDPGFYRCISFPGTSIGEIDKDLHRIRRKVLAPAFSIARVSELAPLVLAQVEQLLAKFDAACTTDDAVNVTGAFHALTLDIISEIVLGTSTNCIERPGFRHDFHDYLEASMGVGWVATAFPTVTTVALYMSSEMNIQVLPNHATQLTRVSHLILNHISPFFSS